MPESNGVVFRIEKTKDYTVMSNHHLRNIKLTLKAKGLLTLMLSLPDNWDYSMNGLVAICGDGFSSVNSGVKELENYGYLRREQERRPDGTMGKVQFFVSELPTLKNGFSSEFVPQDEKPLAVSPPTEKPLTDNHIQSNTNQLSIEKSSINQSIYQDLETFDNQKRIDRIDEIESRIKQQIDFECLLHDYKNRQGQVFEIFEIMLEIGCTQGDYLYIGKDKHLTSLVQRRFSQLDFCSIQYVMNSLNEVTSEIKDIKSYLTKTLFNAPSTQSNYYQTKVQHDFSK